MHKNEGFLICLIHNKEELMYTTNNTPYYQHAVHLNVWSLWLFITVVFLLYLLLPHTREQQLVCLCVVLSVRCAVPAACDSYHMFWCVDLPPDQEWNWGCCYFLFDEEIPLQYLGFERWGRLVSLKTNLDIYNWADLQNCVSKRNTRTIFFTSKCYIHVPGKPTLFYISL